jgi:gamma-glutamyltranspeptidase/glutathione hydrolase
MVRALATPLRAILKGRLRQLLQLLNRAVFGMDLQAAVEAPRFALYGYPQSFEPHESGPDTLRLESRIDRAVVDRLAAIGHRVEDWPATTWKAGAVCAIETDPANGTIQAGADPRRPCAALGF